MWYYRYVNDEDTFYFRLNAEPLKALTVRAAQGG
jgi:hypothetical protein